MTMRSEGYHLPEDFGETARQRLDEILGGDSPELHKSTNPLGALTVTISDQSDEGKLTQAYREAIHNKTLNGNYTDVQEFEGADLVGTTASLFTATDSNGETIVLKISKTEGEIPLTLHETKAFSKIQADGRHNNIVLMTESNPGAGYFALEYVPETLAGKFIEDVLERRKDASKKSLKILRDRKDYLLRRQREAEQSGSRFEHKERRELVGIDEKIEDANKIFDGRIIPFNTNGVNNMRVLRMYVGMLKALKHCHALDIAHRDIKPDNIRYATGGNGSGLEPRLFDFGGAIDLSAVDNGESAFIQWVGSPLYVTRDVVKNVFDFNMTYLDSEQEGLPVDLDERDRILKNQDLVELALTTYHMATGIPPYHDRTAKGWMNYFLASDEENLLMAILDYDKPAIDVDILRKSTMMTKGVATALANSLERCLKGVDSGVILSGFHQDLSEILPADVVSTIYGNNSGSGRTRRIGRPSSYDLNGG